MILWKGVGDVVVMTTPHNSMEPATSLSKPRKKKRTSRRDLVIGLVSGIATYAVFFLIFWTFDFSTSFYSDDIWSGWIMLIAFLVASFFLLVVIRACGHLFSSLLVGFKFSYLIVGPFRIYREHGKLHFGFNTNLAMIGGAVATYPEDTHNLSRRVMVMLLGGPLANLVLVCICWMIVFILPENTSWRGDLFIFGFISFVLFWIAAIPVRVSTFYTDGARILMNSQAR